MKLRKNRQTIPSTDGGQSAYLVLSAIEERVLDLIQFRPYVVELRENKFGSYSDDPDIDAAIESIYLAADAVSEATNGDEDTDLIDPICTKRKTRSSSTVAAIPPVKKEMSPSTQTTQSQTSANRHRPADTIMLEKQHNLMQLQIDSQTRANNEILIALETISSRLDAIPASPSVTNYISPSTQKTQNRANNNEMSNALATISSRLDERNKLKRKEIEDTAEYRRKKIKLLEEQIEIMRANTK